MRIRGWVGAALSAAVLLAGAPAATADPPSAPPAPTVTSRDYPCNQVKPVFCRPHGGAGVGGQFTFSVGGDADVVGYVYGFSDPPGTTATVTAGADLTVSLAPPSYGLATLNVQSLDGFGQRSVTRHYQFLVSAPSAPIAYWTLDNSDSLDGFVDRQGGSNLTSPAGNGDVVAVPDARYVGSDRTYSYTVGFDQTPGAPHGIARASERRFDTARSFSIEASARLDDVADDHVAVSKDGRLESVVRLGYDASRHGWCLTLRGRDDPAAPVVAVCSPSATVGLWTHLLGVYDDTAQTLTLWVDRVEYTLDLTTQPDFLAAWSGGWDAGGALVIGGARDQRRRVETFTGEVSDVRLWTRVVTTTELLGDPATLGLLDPRSSGGEVGDWMFADQPPGCACATRTLDGARFERTLVPSGAGVSSIDGDVDGNAAWRFDGVSGSAATTGPALRTEQSFTVAAWVRPSRSCSGPIETALAQDGAQTSAFTLDYACRRHVCQLRVYFDGALIGAGAAHAPAFFAAGAFTVGRGLAAGAPAELFAGDVDDVELWQGILPDYAIAAGV